jgi:hypothetical protein
MKFVIGSVATLAGVLFMCSMASANPAPVAEARRLSDEERRQPRDRAADRQ